MITRLLRYPPDDAIAARVGFAVAGLSAAWACALLLSETERGFAVSVGGLLGTIILGGIYLAPTQQRMWGGKPGAGHLTWIVYAICVVFAFIWPADPDSLRHDNLVTVALVGPPIGFLWTATKLARSGGA